jgi:S1-C subfamily serine protease
LFAGPGANAALTTIVYSSPPGSNDKLVAQTALTGIYERFAPSIAKVEVNVTALDKTSSQVVGTAFFIAKDGYAITSAHIFKDNADTSNSAVEVRVTPVAGGSSVSATIVSIQHETDLALIKVPLTPERVPITGEGKPLIGENVSILGFPFGCGLSLITGIVSSLDAPKGSFLVKAYPSGSGPTMGSDKGGRFG